MSDFSRYTDEELEEVLADPMQQNACIYCGTFTNWSESLLCAECGEEEDRENVERSF